MADFTKILQQAQQMQGKLQQIQDELGNMTVTGVSGTKGGLGYFGLSYLQENEGKVKGVQVDGGSGCVAPSTETVRSSAGMTPRTNAGCSTTCS